MVNQWKKVSFKDVCFIDAPMVNPQEAQYQLLPHIGNENIEKHTGRLLKFNTVRDDHLISGKYYFCETDVLYGKINPQFGKVAFPGFCGLCSADMYPIRCSAVLEPNFLKYILLTKDFTDYSVSVSMRSGMPKVNRNELAVYEFDIPSMSEQKAIAEALSDADTLIVNLEKLIAKKKAIKQGAMQELLTGTRRLPGFDGEWKTTQIGSLTSVFSGGTPSTTNPLYWGGSIPWMSSGELNMKIVREVRGRITALGMENSSTRMIPAFCILIGLAGQGKTRGTAAFNMFPLCTNQSIAAVFPNDSQFNSKFLYYYMDTKYTELRELSDGGGGRGGLTKKLIEDFYITIPSDINEQTSIAEILTDIDDEIENLERKLYKTKSIKQGMMSELLTGKIRLIDKEDA